MKWFFYALLVTNLALFGWLWQQQRIPVAAVPSVSPPVEGQRSLVLLGELRRNLPQRAAAPTTAPPSQAAAMVAPRPSTLTATSGTTAPQPPAPAQTQGPDLVCTRISGLESEQEAEHLGQLLAKAGAVLRGHGSEAGEGSRYWVMLPPFKSAAAAAPTLEHLKKAGVKDFYLIRSGENKNAISLGVFAGKESAERRYREVRSLKFKAHIDEITVTTTRGWLEFAWPAATKESWRRVLPKSQRDLAATACK